MSQSPPVAAAPGKARAANREGSVGRVRVVIAVGIRVGASRVADRLIITRVVVAVRLGTEPQNGFRVGALQDTEVVVEEVRTQVYSVRRPLRSITPLIYERNWQIITIFKEQ